MSGYLTTPPVGVEPDWSRQGWAPTIKSLCIAFLVLNTIFVAARVYTRSMVLKTFGVDDCFCLCAYAVIVAQSALVLKALPYGFGRHSYDVPKSKAEGLYYSYFVLGLLPGVIYFFIKMTFFLTYARIFNPAKHMRYLIWGGAAVTSAFYLGDFLYDVFQCQPIAKAWNPFLEGHCAKESVPGGPTGIYNVISDFYILVLPLPMVWSLNMDWKRRIKLLSIFSLGAFTFAMSIARLAITVISSKKKDKTYVVGQICIWATLEWSVGLIVVCLIVCPVLWNRVINKSLVEYWTRILSAYQSLVSVSGDRGASRDDMNESKAELHKPVFISRETESA